MATVLKVTRLSNPRRGAGPRRTVRRRKMTPLQKKYFGSKRQRAAVSRRKPSRARRIVKANRPRARRTFNPALVATLGAMNPHQRRKNVARTRKRRQSTARRVNRRRKTSRATNPPRRRRRNSTRIVVVAPRRRRRSNPRRAPRRVNRRHSRRSRNPIPQIGGSQIFSKSGAKLIGGGLVGVAAVKFIPTLLPTSITSAMGNGALISIAVAGASAVAAGWLADKVDPKFGEGVLFGGLMMTGSVALNAFLPGLAVAGVPLGLSGMGELIPGTFVVPQNPIRAAIAPPAPPAAQGAHARVTTNGLSRAFGTAY